MQTARLPALLAAFVVSVAAAAAATTPAGMDVHDLGMVEGAGPFGVTLRSCTFREERLECVLKVHNKLPTPSPLWIEEAVLYDTDGALYRAAAAKLSGRSDDLSDPRREPVRIDVPAETPAQVRLVFAGVSRQRRKAETLLVTVGGFDPVQFQDFHFARE